MSSAACERCQEPKSEHNTGAAGDLWCRHAVGVEYKPQPKGETMKSKLEILHEVVAERLRHVSVMGKIGVSAGFEAEGTASAVRAEQLKIVLDDILFAEAASDAGDDHGAELALVTVDRDRLGDLVRRRDEAIERIKSESDYHKAALTAAEGERDKAWQDSAKLLGGRDRAEAALNRTSAVLEECESERNEARAERDKYSAVLVQMRSNLRSRDAMVALATEALS